MAAKTPSSIIPMVSGNRRGYIAIFSDIDDGDTFATSTSAEPSHWDINNKTDGTVISATFSSGTFTFTVAGAGSNKTASMEVIF